MTKGSKGDPTSAGPENKRCSKRVEMGLNYLEFDYLLPMGGVS